MISCNNAFYISFFIIEASIIALFSFVKYKDYPYGTNVSKNPEMEYFYKTISISHFKILSDLSIFMLVGLGFLVSYLRFHRWMSLALTFFVACFSMQIYILIAGFWNKVFNGLFGLLIVLYYSNIIGAMKAAITVLISMGTLIGKVDTFQMMIM